jgi:hypothetical protein
MKKLLTLFSSLAFVSLCYSQIPNASFETWQNYAGVNVFGSPFTGEYPTGWQTSDSTFQYYTGPHSAVREATDICNASFAIKLTSVTALSNTGPGVATNGKIVNPTTIVGGSPFTARPAYFNVCLKYVPTGTDSGRVSAVLYRWNGVSRDTIAIAASAIYSIPTMTPSQFTFVYRDLVNSPDTILVVLASGQGIGSTTAGSYLTADNVSTSGTVGISENSLLKNISVYPQPAQNELNFNLPSGLTASLNYEMRDISGRLVMNGKINASDSKVDINKLGRGNYFVSLRNEEGAMIYTSKFTVSK